MNAEEAYEVWHRTQFGATIKDAFMGGWDARGAVPSVLHTSLVATAAESIWAHWPIKKAKGAAIPAIVKAIKKRGSSALMADVMEYAAAIATWKPEDRQFVPMCSTWMNQERWLDDRSTWQRGTVHKSQFSQSH